MKLLSNKIFLPFSTSELSGLKIQVKETLDIHFSERKNKKFSAADLWNIQKQKRIFSRREYFRG